MNLKIAFILSGLLIVTTLGLAQEKKCYDLGETIPGIPTPDKVCCGELKIKDLKEGFDNKCRSLGAGGYAGICVACGDSVCDKRYESKCNCPEDCDKPVINKGH